MNQVSLLSQTATGNFSREMTKKELIQDRQSRTLLAARGIDETRKVVAKRIAEEEKVQAAKAAAAAAEEEKRRKEREMIVSESEVYLLARIIVAEAEDQPYKGKVAVGAVVINRVKSGKFPNTIRGVIYQRGQFSPVSNGRFYRVNVTAEDIEAARDALRGEDPTYGSLFFYAPGIVKSGWIRSRTVKTVIGDHNFAI